MKKLLAAVTSVAMSASFITSAFASSFTVSAAGGVSAVQPNISTEEVLDEAATKKADNETKTDFTIEPEARTAKPGETIENIPVIIQSNGRSVATLVFELPEDLPAGWKVEPSELGCYCSELEGVEFKKLDKTYNVNTLQPGKGHPMPIIDGAEMVYINITVPADAKPGDYEYYFNRFFVVEATKPELIQYNGTILPGKITIEGDEPTPDTTAPAPGTTTKPAPDTTKAPDTTTTKTPPVTGDDHDTKDDFTIEPEARTAKPGETIENIPVIIQSNGRSVATLVFELPEDLPAGWKVEPSELGCYCSELEGVEFKKLDKTYNVNTLQPGKGHPMPIIDGAEMVYINITVPADAKPGDYEYYFNRFFVVEATKPELIQYNGTILPGKITIEGDTPAETTTKTPVGTTTKAPDTTKKPDTTTNKTPGKVLYGDANDNGEVNIADVVVLNKWLHNNEDYAMTDQGKINANCCDVSADKINAEDSDAIIKSIVSLVTLPCAASDLK